MKYYLIVTLIPDNSYEREIWFNCSASGYDSHYFLDLSESINSRKDFLSLKNCYHYLYKERLNTRYCFKIKILE